MDVGGVTSRDGCFLRSTRFLLGEEHYSHTSHDISLVRLSNGFPGPTGPTWSQYVPDCILIRTSSNPELLSCDFLMPEVLN